MKNHKSSKNPKFNKGIALISLVITIIVMLILSVVTVNGIFGENGLIEKVKETRMLAILADVIENLQNNVIEITTNNLIINKRTVSSEMVDSLDERRVVKKDVTKTRDYLLQSVIENKDLDGITVGFNGDIWVDNYKRGKVELSQNINKLTTPDNKTKITVIDGTIEEISENHQYYLHALPEKRDIFAYWVNQYGEIISFLPDTIFEAEGYSEVEITALYGFNYLSDLSKNSRSWVTFETKLEMDDYGSTHFRLSSTFLDGNCYYVMPEIFSELPTVTASIGGLPIRYGIVYSDDYEKLINRPDRAAEYGWVDNDFKKESLELDGEPGHVVINEENLMICNVGEKLLPNAVIDADNKPQISYKPDNYDSLGRWTPSIIFGKREDLEYFSQRIEEYEIFDDIEEKLGVKKGKRLYYRGFLYFVMKKITLDADGKFTTENELTNTGENYIVNYYEPTIKFIDL